MISGILQSLFNWQTVFLVSVPVGIISFLMCYKILERGETEKVKWDISGTLLQYICIFSTVYLLNSIQNLKIDLLTVVITAVVIITLGC